MKIEVKDELFSKLAKDLKTTPENVVKIFLDHASDLPHSVWIDAIQENSSLDNALEKLMKNAEVAFTLGDLIEKIVGDHDYIIDDGDYNFEKGLFWFNIAFLEGDKGEINSLHLQFGNDSGEIITASIQDLVLEKNVNEFLDEINTTIDGFVDVDHEFTFEYEWIEHNYLTFSIQIDTSEILDLPKVKDLEGMVKKIKKIIKSHDTRKKLT